MTDSPMSGGNEILATTGSADSSGTVQAAPVSGSDLQNKTDTTAAVKTPAGYVSPQPVSGSNGFNKYIEENLRKPQTLPEGGNAVAVVSFVVRATGNIDSIKVLSSPGEEYTAEAIRLIKEGPAWKPAENNGRVIEDEKMLRIVFK
jgi:outer membrane biosynthesis protein TonB